MTASRQTGWDNAVGRARTKGKVRDRLNAGTATAKPPRILLIDLDPYLALLIQRGLPAAEVSTADGSSDLDQPLLDHPDLVVIDLDNRRLPQVLLHRDEVRILGLTRAGEGTGHQLVDAVVVRPFLSLELQRTVAQLLGSVQPIGATAQARPRRLREWLAPARVGAALLAGALELLAGGFSPGRLTVFLAVLAYAGARLRLLRGTRLGTCFDAAIGITLVATTGGHLSAYALFALVATVGAGLLLGPVDGVIAASLISGASIPALVEEVAAGVQVGLADVLPFLLLFPAAAIAGGQASRIWDDEGHRSSLAVLAEANRALTSFYDIARKVPRSLTLPSVAEAALDEAVALLNGHAAVLLIEEAGVVYEVGAVGLVDHTRVLAECDDPAVAGLRSEQTREVPAEAVPEGWRRSAPEGSRWTITPLHHAGARMGTLVVVLDRAMQSQELRALEQIAQETALAVENARLFAHVRQLSVDEERERFAKELHDGVAQSLAHVRLELEFLARHGGGSPEGLRREAHRLAHVAERGLADVRSAIADLRTSTVPGLGVALRGYCADLRTLTGPDLRVETRTCVRLASETEADIFRIARDAIGNALRHADVSLVTVEISEVGDGLRLVVEDDGRVLPREQDRRAQRENAGVRAMQERAALLGAALDLSRTDVATNRVTLVCPFSAVAHNLAATSGAM